MERANEGAPTGWHWLLYLKCRRIWHLYMIGTKIIVDQSKASSECIQRERITYPSNKASFV